MKNIIKRIPSLQMDGWMDSKFDCCLVFHLPLQRRLKGPFVRITIKAMPA